MRVLKKLPVIILFDVVLAIIAAQNISQNEIIFVLILLVVCNIDIFLKKIPTEFLILTGIFSIIIIILEKNWTYFISGIILFGIFYHFYKKMGMSIYDTVLICLLSFHFYSIAAQVKFISIIFIIWGFFGASRRFIIKGNSSPKIPLAPIITFSYFLVLFLCSR